MLSQRETCENITPTYEVGTNIVTVGYVRKHYANVEVGTNIVTVGNVRKHYTNV